MNTDPLDRKKRYYQKHRNKILKTLKDKRQLPTHKPAGAALCASFQRLYSVLIHHAEKLLLALLVLSCTAYLVVENARTLAAIEGSGALAKALLCEAVLVGVSMLAVSTRRIQIMRLAVLVGISTLSLLSTIGGPLTSYTQARQHLTSQREESVILGRTIAQKQVLLERYLATNRISGARRIESEIAVLTDRLTSVKNGIAEQRSEVTLGLGFAIEVLFRLITMAANVIFANQLGQLLRERRVQTCPDVSTRPKLHLVRT